MGTEVSLKTIFLVCICSLTLPGSYITASESLNILLVQEVRYLLSVPLFVICFSLKLSHRVGNDLKDDVYESIW